MNRDLFGSDRESIGAQSVVLRGFAPTMFEQELEAIFSQSPLRHMQTPGGFTMSVAMSNCGSLGWTTDKSGYRYTQIDPLTQRPWPEMPPRFLELARSAATAAGFERFTPDACLINRYDPGARMSLHQDKNEHDFSQPIVSVSWGLPATFLFGGEQRSDRPKRIPLVHGDVVVWGGVDRLKFHGINPLKAGAQAHRINLTFRNAGR